jgi:hypothetical protein
VSTSTQLQTRLRRIRRELDECAEQVERLAAAIPAPEHPQLVSTGEIVAMLGVKAVTVRAWKARGLLPAPVAELSAGTIWLRADIENWARERAA